MALSDKRQYRRLNLPYFDGINSVVGDNVAKLPELWHGENVRSSQVGIIEKRGGYEVLGGALSSTANYGLAYFNTSSPKFYRVSTVSGTTSLYYLDSNLAWTALTGGGTSLTAAVTDFTQAENCLFFVNGTDSNRYVQSNGTTVVTASTTTGHTYNSPPAYKINFYKGRLYLGDYTISGGTREKNGVMFSSPLLGIVSLVDGDYVGGTTLTSLKVTDTKYIYASDSLEIYRGTSRITFNLGDSTTQFDITNPSGTTFRYTYDSTGTDPLITTYVAVNTELTINAQNFNANNNGTFTVTAVGANYFEITNSAGVVESNKTIGTGSISVNNIVVSAKKESSITITAFNANVNSADELWVKGTKLGSKVFRWAGDGATGEKVKEYDTFKMEGSDFTEITMMENIGDVMMIASKNNLAVWNDYNLRNFDLGIGCCSPQGYVKGWGTLFFVHYQGIYATDGGVPKLISNKVQRYFDGASRSSLELAVGGRHNYSVYFYVGDVTLYNEDGSTEKTLTDVVLEYYLKQENWFVHTNINVDYMSYYLTQSSGLEYLAFSSPDTDLVYIYPYGTDDNDTDIFFNATTNNIALNKDFEKFSYPKEVILEMPKGNTLHTFVSLDDGPFYEAEGTAKKGCSVVKITARTPQENPARCRKLRLSFREASQRACKISQAAIIYDVTEEEEEH